MIADAQPFLFRYPTDEKILLDLGDCTDRRSDFIDGLRKYLQQFRERDVRDFDTIAKGILDYRRKFYGDDSRILPLDGVTI